MRVGILMEIVFKNSHSLIIFLISGSVAPLNMLELAKYIQGCLNMLESAKYSLNMRENELFLDDSFLYNVKNTL